LQIKNKGQKGMISMDNWTTIKNLKKINPTMGTRTIAKLVGVSRNTVKKALQEDGAPIDKKEGVKKLNENIEPFEGFIKESFLKKNLKASRILKDIRSKGYQGSQYALYSYIKNELKPIKEDIQGNNPRAYKSYSTSPGEQMQFDWAHYTVPIDGNLVKIYIHQTILGFSRLKSFVVTLSMTQSDIFTALEDAFNMFNGVCERIQVDNAKVFIDNASVNDFKWNKRFLHFCGFYGVKPTRSLPAHPWSKGKVEKPFDYLENHFIAGNEFRNFEDLQQRLQQFQDETNNLLHGTTQEITIKRFQQKEQEFLKPLPLDNLTGEIKRYIGFKEEFRKVSCDCLISYKGNKYSIPHYFATKEVWIKVVYGNTLQVYSSKNKLIASHVLSLGKKEIIINKKHFEGYRKTNTTIAVTISRLVKRFGDYINIHQFISNVKVQKRINPADHLLKIANLFEYYNNKDCILAMEECFTLNMFNANIIKGCITNNTTPKKETIDLLNIELPKGDVKRDLGDYKL
jgi:transposase